MGARTLLLLFLEFWVLLRGRRGSAEERGQGSRVVRGQGKSDISLGLIKSIQKQEIANE